MAKIRTPFPPFPPSTFLASSYGGRHSPAHFLLAQRRRTAGGQIAPGISEAIVAAGERAFIQELLRQSESINLVRNLCLRFKTLMETKQAAGLAQWCEEAGVVAALSGFVRGLRQDYAAVEQAFSSEWSNGQTEGQVNRLKTIKRQMYGKAGFALLRLRVLFRNRTAPPD